MRICNANPMVGVSDGRTVEQYRMDQLQERYAAVYTLPDGKKVRVRAHFTRNYEGSSARNRVRLTALFDAYSLWSGKPAEWKQRIANVTSGRGSPDDIRLVTQKLIDAGLVPASATSAEEGVRVLMFNYGIGLDCVGYAAQAVMLASGKSAGLTGVMRDGDGLFPSTNPNFKRVALESAQPGDLFALEGHNAVLYARGTYGKWQSFTVDGSWGANGNSTYVHGGVDRRVWLYDPATRAWAELLDGKLIMSSSDGPYHHEMIGVFRPK